MTTEKIKVPTVFEALEVIHKRKAYNLDSAFNNDLTKSNSVTFNYRDSGEVKQMTIEFAISEKQFNDELSKATAEALKKGNPLRTFCIKGNDDVIYTFDNDSFELVGRQDDAAKTLKEIHKNALEILEEFQEELKDLTFQDEDGVSKPQKWIYAERRKSQAIIAYCAVWDAFMALKANK